MARIWRRGSSYTVRMLISTTTIENNMEVPQNRRNRTAK
jgi:hypothetical protein